MSIFNYSAGPSALNQVVKDKAFSEFLSYENKGFNIAEISHRSKDYEAINDYAHEALLRLYGLNSDEYGVCFMQGGATTQFSLVAMNFSKDANEPALINMIDTDVWTAKAASEQTLAGAEVKITASSKDSGYDHLPNPQNLKDASFTYLCSNNTVAGTQYDKYPSNCGDLIIDASSDFLSRKIDFSNIAVIFAGAQKNAGIAGITPVIVRKDFIARSQAAKLPKMFKHHTHIEAKSLFNTPPTWAVYIFSLVLRWLEDLGGLDVIAEQNERKAKALYEYLDKSDFYKPLVQRDRSLMNVCFAAPNAELDAKFVAAANSANLLGLKGHKLKGGLRASIYNANDFKSIERLLDFMDEFRSTHC